MRRRAGSAVFFVASADAAVLLGDLQRDEPSALYAEVFKRLTAAFPIAEGHAEAFRTALPIAEGHAEAFRTWLDRAKLQHARNGDSMKAQAFERIQRSERLPSQSSSTTANGSRGTPRVGVSGRTTSTRVPNRFNADFGTS
jgi:hypothetical protein